MNTNGDLKRSRWLTDPGIYLSVILRYGGRVGIGVGDSAKLFRRDDLVQVVAWKGISKQQLASSLRTVAEHLERSLIGDRVSPGTTDTATTPLPQEEK